MSKLEIKKCVLEIIDSLGDRKGFDDWWYNLDDDIEKEIITELESIIERRLNKDEFNTDDIFTSHMVPPHLFGLKEDDGVGTKSLEMTKQNKGDRTMDKLIESNKKFDEKNKPKNDDRDSYEGGFDSGMWLSTI